MKHPPARDKKRKLQLAIACRHGIPPHQAYTVNIGRYERYIAWLQTPLVRLERFLDGMEAARRSRGQGGD